MKIALLFALNAKKHNCNNLRTYKLHFRIPSCRWNTFKYKWIAWCNMKYGIDHWSIDYYWVRDKRLWIATNIPVYKNKKCLFENQIRRSNEMRNYTKHLWWIRVAEKKREKGEKYNKMHQIGVTSWSANFRLTHTENASTK